MREHSGSDFDESRRVTDREDAPKVVKWRGYELVRGPIVSHGECYGFENRVSLLPPEPCPFYGVTISCEGNRAHISLELDMESGSFEGEGKNEIEALDNAAASFEKFMGAMSELIQ